MEKITVLDKFRKAHESDYETALEEIRNGRKRSCWMWYIFPQSGGLGTSVMSEHFAIKDIEEARLFYEDAYLGKNLVEICNVLLDLKTDDAEEVFGFPDCLKLKSSMTLFSIACPEEKVFQAVLDKYCKGEKDLKTIRVLEDNIV